MTRKRSAAYLLVILSGVFTSGCFSIEQEIFLNADGSGQLVMFISLPDLPEKMTSSEAGSKKDPASTMADFKKELTTALPPTIKLVEAKEVKQNGVQSIYVVFYFKQLSDVQRVLANFGKSSLKDNEMGSAPEWTLSLAKQASRTLYTQKFLVDVDAKAEARTSVKVNGKEQAKKPGAEEEKASKEMEEQLKPLMLSIVRMRFVLHAPSPITSSNADIVLNGKTAVWNCSLAAFAKDKKPIEMKASF
ncbi:MAG: hypothetical protein WAU45_14885 [Blastocatellia bacterium]